MYSRRNVSSPMLVVCLLFQDLTKFLRLCSRFEQVHPKSRTGKKKVVECLHTHVTHIELCLTNWQGQGVSGSRNKERESAVSGSQNVREEVLRRREYI